MDLDALDASAKGLLLVGMFAFVVWVMSSNRPPPPALLVLDDYVR